MTEVPEHLLQRSKERRAALGLGGGGGEGGSPPATPSEAPGTGAAASAVEPAGDAPAAADVPAVVEEPPRPLPPFVVAANQRPKVPKWAVPVLAVLPLWGLVYAGTMTAGGGEADPQMALGAEVYGANCASCHGASGGGGVGRPLGQVLETFPDRADHIDWVKNGSPEAGTPYGAQGRTSQSDGFGQMPGFEGSLSEEEIAAVVRYEREEFGGEEPAVAPEGEGATEAEGGTEGEQPSGEGEGSGSDTADAESSGGDVGGDTGGHEGDQG